MLEILKSRGFWVGVAAVLSAVAAQFPQTQGWIGILLVAIGSFTGHFIVGRLRTAKGKPKSYAKAEDDTERLTKLNDLMARGAKEGKKAR